MTKQRRYEQYEINPTVLLKAAFAFNEHFWQRGVELPDDAKECLKDALEDAVRAAVNSGRSSGWFKRDGAVGAVKNDFKVHLFCGDGGGGENGDVLQVRRSKYGFDIMQPGQSYMVECDHLGRLRASACLYAKKRGWRLRVNAAVGGGRVTRIA